MNNLMRSATVILALFALTSPVGAGQIPLFNTGVDSNGQPLAAGAADPHYQLISSPVTSLNTSFIAGNIPSSYIPDSTNSQWIAPGVNLISAYPAGSYIYQTTFNLEGFDPTSAVITGAFSSDNAGIILLNGVSTGITSAPAEFTAFTSFIISDGFVVGLNTLDFVITNDNVSYAVNPTALRVELSGTGSAAAVPEPTSLVMLASGVIGLLGYMRCGRARAKLNDLKSRKLNH